MARPQHNLAKSVNVILVVPVVLWVIFKATGQLRIRFWKRKRRYNRQLVRLISQAKFSGFRSVINKGWQMGGACELNNEDNVYAFNPNLTHLLIRLKI